MKILKSRRAQMSNPTAEIGTQRQLSASYKQRLQHLAKTDMRLDLPLADARFIVVDVESTGLDILKDQVIAIGAVTIDHQAIQIGEALDLVVRRDVYEVNAATMVHGLAPETIRAGKPPQEALLAWLELSQNAIMLAFHAEFDRLMLQRAAAEDLGYTSNLPFIDLAEMAPCLNPEQAHKLQGLDAWLAHFSIAISQRHHAAADAFASAELALILLSQCQQQGITTLGKLQTELGHWRSAWARTRKREYRL